jgi:hypothetical protein
MNCDFLHLLQVEAETTTTTFLLFLFLCFTDATTLCESWPPPWFRNRTFFWDGVVGPMPNTQPGGPVTALHQFPTL